MSNIESLADAVEGALFDFGWERGSYYVWPHRHRNTVVIWRGGKMCEIEHRNYRVSQLVEEVKSVMNKLAK